MQNPKTNITLQDYDNVILFFINRQNAEKISALIPSVEETLKTNGIETYNIHKIYPAQLIKGINIPRTSKMSRIIHCIGNDASLHVLLNSTDVDLETDIINPIPIDKNQSAMMQAIKKEKVKKGVLVKGFIPAPLGTVEYNNNRLNFYHSVKMGLKGEIANYLFQRRNMPQEEVEKAAINFMRRYSAKHIDLDFKFIPGKSYNGEDVTYKYGVSGNYIEVDCYITSDENLSINATKNLPTRRIMHAYETLESGIALSTTDVFYEPHALVKSNNMFTTIDNAILDKSDSVDIQTYGKTFKRAV